MDNIFLSNRSVVQVGKETSWIIASQELLWAKDETGNIPITTVGYLGQPLKIEDLPLYVGWPIITPRFAKLLKSKKG